MRSRCRCEIVLILCSSVLFLLPFEARAQAPLAGTLQWQANRARAQGSSTAEIVLGIESFDYTPTLSDIAKQSLFVDGLVESSIVVATPDAFDVQTWYRVKVLARGQQPSANRVAAKVFKIPEQLRDLQSDEIAVRTVGGTAVVDGISITETAEPPLTVGARYLFFLDPTTQPSIYDPTLAPPVQIDKGGTILHPAKKTNFSRSIEGYRDAEELEREVQRAARNH